MSYFDIILFGWVLNISMLFVNTLLFSKYMRLENLNILEEEKEIILELQEEAQKYYPNKKRDELISYLVPFTLFFKVSFSFFTMITFFLKNRDSNMYDFIVYKHYKEIAKARARY